MPTKPPPGARSSLCRWAGPATRLHFQPPRMHRRTASFQACYDINPRSLPEIPPFRQHINPLQMRPAPEAQAEVFSLGLFRGPKGRDPLARPTGLGRSPGSIPHPNGGRFRGMMIISHPIPNVPSIAIPGRAFTHRGPSGRCRLNASGRQLRPLALSKPHFSPKGGSRGAVTKK